MNTTRIRKRWEYAAVTLVALSLSLALPAIARQPAASPAAAPTVRESALRSVAETWIARSGAPGVTIAAIGPDGVLIKAAAGFSRLSTQTPMKPDDRMFSGSIGKTYFAAVILQLVAEGKLSLDEKLSAYVGNQPWFATLPNAQGLTLRVLMNHTSGIAEHVESPEFLAALKAEPMKHWDFGELLQQFTCGRPALFDVGTGWSYADTNYIVAGLAVEKVTGKPMYAMVRERLLVPLKLDNTIPSEGPEIPGLITGYEGPNHLFTDADEFAVDGKCVLNPQFEWCGGGFVCTSPDLARWGRAVWAGDVIPPAMKIEMMKVIPEQRSGPNDSYGLGVIVWKSPLGRAIGHAGMFPGYVSQVFHFEDSNITVAMQTNTLDFSKLKGLRQVVGEAARAMGAREAAPK